MTHMGKVNGVANADIARVNGVSMHSIWDNWSDNILTSRTAEGGNKINGLDEMIAPEWTTAGSPSGAGGLLTLPAGAGAHSVLVASTFTTGVWEWKAEGAANEVVADLHLYGLYEDANNYYMFVASVASDWARIYKNAAGGGNTLVAGGAAVLAINTQYANKVSRDSSGNWVYSIDGTPKGSATDAWLPAQALQKFLSSDKAKEIDDLRVHYSEDNRELVREVKANGVQIECPYIGDGSVKDPYRPAIVDENFAAFFHLDAKDVDLANHKAKIWISKSRTAGAVVADIKSKLATLGSVLVGETTEVAA